MKSGPEYLAARRLLTQFEALEINGGYIELVTQMRQEHSNCLRGLRNRQLPVAERQEFLEGADLTERLLRFVGERVAALRRETTLTAAELRALGLAGEDGV